MHINHIVAITAKQFKDSIKNKMIVVVFFMFPILAAVFDKIISEEELQSLLPSFSTMNIVMIPIIFMSSIVSEEKEKGSLRMLIMSNVSPMEYLIGIGVSVFSLSLVSTSLFLFFLDVTIKEALIFICIATIGIMHSLIIGALLALFCKNQMSVGPTSAPISMIIGLLPMFGTMNSKIEDVAYVLYSYHIRKSLLLLEFPNSIFPYIVVLINFAILIFLFMVTYRIKGLKSE